MEQTKRKLKLHDWYGLCVVVLAFTHVHLRYKIQKKKDAANVNISFSFMQSSFVGAIAVGDLVKSTLGPKGMVSVVLSVRTSNVIVTGEETPLLSSIRTRSC